MKQKISLIALIVCFALVITAAAVVYNRLSDLNQPEQLATVPQSPAPPAVEVTDEPGQTETVTEPQLAPDFTVYTKDGTPAKLSDFRGKPVVLNFWASWCPPCKAEMPDFQAAWEQHGENVHFLMVNMTDGMQETQAQAEEFLKNAGYTFPVYFDTATEAATTYAVYSIPSTYFIGAGGEAVAYATGAIDADTLQAGLDMILPA